MKRFGVLLLVAAAAVFAACGRNEKGQAAAADRRLETSVVVERDLPGRIEVEGAVVGREEAVLASRLSAPVTEVSAVPGQSVRAGTVLVRLEPAEADSALAGARSSLAAARAAFDLAAKNRERFEKLASRGAAAVVELDRASQDVAAASAAVASAQAAARRAETDRAQASLTAPFDAVVIEKMVSPGDLAAPGRPLVRLASISGRRVQAEPAEEDAARLTVGDPVDVVLTSGPVRGRVAEIIGAVDPATRRRTVRIDLPAGVDPAVGSFARVVLPGPRETRLVVPSRAVVERGGLELAWAVGPDRRVSLRYVRTGAAAGEGLVEVRSGLEAGERIVLDPPTDLEAGARVRS